MGLMIIKDGELDADVLNNIAEEIAILWNEGQGKEKWGFDVTIGRKEIESCCKQGDRLLKKYLAPEFTPGPFKRVGTLVVLSHLYPFFKFNNAPSAGTATQWNARFSALLIPAALEVLKVKTSDQGKSDEWSGLSWFGFPSFHYKLDFLAWLAMMERPFAPLPTSEAPLTEEDRAFQKMEDHKLARMALATALMIEACYYCDEPAKVGVGACTCGGAGNPCCIKGICTSILNSGGFADLSPLTYDALLYPVAK